MKRWATCSTESSGLDRTADAEMVTVEGSVLVFGGGQLEEMSEVLRQRRSWTEMAERRLVLLAEVMSFEVS